MLYNWQLPSSQGAFMHGAPLRPGSPEAVMVVCTGAKSFLTGVGPRALSNGLNSGIFFCFFELLKQVGSCHLMALVQPSAACISWRQYLSASSCKQSLPACDEDLAC